MRVGWSAGSIGPSWAIRAGAQYGFTLLVAIGRGVADDGGGFAGSQRPAEGPAETTMTPFEAHALLPDRPFRSHGDYVAATGEDAVAKALATAPDELIAEITRAGLRGRGGAGFPTGVKWRGLREHACPTKYVVCNAAEGEPGTFKDRFLLRRNPYATIEGMIIAAHAIGAEKGYIALKGSFRREIERVRVALAEMKEQLGTLVIEVVEGPEEYLFGEEKALLNVIEGEGPLPREADNPPYEVGLFATPGSPNPALVNNAESYAHVPSIVRHGAASFREVGTSDTPGTVIFTISGDVERPGVYEQAAGISLRELIFDVAGGLGEGRRLKAILGGVSAAVIGPDKLDTPADFGHLAAIGAGLGSAGLIVYDDRRSLGRVAQAVARFLYVESCNQCSACKTNLGLASAALDELAGGATAPDLAERALFSARHAPQANRCYLPVQGAIVIPSLVKRFRADFERMALAEEILVPKMVDFDEEHRVFSYDDQQPRKLPSWTYRAAPPAHRAAPPPEAPPVAPARPVSVTLDADVAAALQGLDGDVGEQANAALRAWLAQRAKRG
jgi:NADH-quinone oxidoreductase subunit F